MPDARRCSRAATHAPFKIRHSMLGCSVFELEACFAPPSGALLFRSGALRCAGTGMSKATSSGTDFGTELSPGLRVCGARYLLKRLVGRGEFSELWLARDIKNTRDIALKFLPKALLQDVNLMEFFQEEVRRETLLKHPHIVLTYELARDYDSAVIAMEFVDGWSLATLKVDKPDRRYDVREIEPWVRDLCDALVYAHSEFGIIHGDLKPSNLLLSSREGIKVSDFGFAAQIRNESSKRGIIKSGYGGIGFLSPQQVMGEAPVKADDIYSLGATIFDLLTGTPPFYKGEVVAQICGLKPPRMTQRLAELTVRSGPISPVWEETVAACLAKNPADRPQNVEEVLRLLERSEPLSGAKNLSAPAEAASSATGQSAENAEPTPVPAASPGPRRFRPLVAGIAAVLVTVGLVAAFWIVRSGKVADVLATGHFGASAGSLDTRFESGTGADDSVRCVALLPDGKMLIGGVFKNFDGVADSRIVRLNADGSLDKTFAPQIAGTVSTIVPLDNGQVLIGGEGMVAGLGWRKVVRLNANGSLDKSFDSIGFNRDVMAMAVQSDGKVVVGGRFVKAFGKPHVGLVRMTRGGGFDDSFDVGSGPGAAVFAVAVQPDGKILAAGDFQKFNNQKAGHLVRLNPDGTFDAGFDDGSGADKDILSVLVQKDGKILISGNFDNVNGLPCPHIARLNADGSLDSSFHAPNGLGNELHCMAVQPDGRIVAGGDVTVNGAARPVLVRFNPDGSLDKGFQVTGATGYGIWDVGIQSDAKILVVGRFSSLDGVLCGNIARLQD